MKTKMLIGICAICLFAVNAVQVEAATPQARAVKNVVNVAKKTSDKIASTLWRNKGGIAVGTVATVAVMAPEAVVQGATSVATGAVESAATVVTGAAQAAVQNVSNSGSGFFSYLLLAMLFLAGLWLFTGFVKSRWRVLPLLVLGVILCLCSTAEAGMIASIPEIQATAPATPWWNIIGIILFIIAILI